MKPRIIRGNNSWSGSIEIVELPREDWPGETVSNRDHIESYSRYTWSPPAQLASLIPEEFSISFICEQSKGGLRRFMPYEVHSFLAWSGVVGHAILEAQGKIQSDLPLTYEEFRFVGSYVQHTQEFMGSTRKIERELRVRKSGRITHSNEDKDVLPQHVGLDAQGAGQRWSLLDFEKEGLEAAKAKGITSPTPKDIFVHGLSAAARLCPLPLEEHEVPPLIRTALFSLGPAPFSPDKAGQDLKSETIRFVAKEFTKVIKERPTDSDEDFNQWLVDSKSNLFHRISKKVRCPSSRLGVRQAFVELGVQATWLQGDGIDAMMRNFCSLIPEPLTGCEAEIFDLCYLKMACFGNLPLALLNDRLTLFEPIIKSIWRNPNSKTELQIFYRALIWFAEMLDLRRSADRRKKKQKNVIPEEQRLPPKKTMP